MKKIFLTSIILSISVMAINANVLLSDFRTTHGVVPFDKITVQDFEPAIIPSLTVLVV